MAFVMARKARVTFYPARPLPSPPCSKSGVEVHCEPQLSDRDSVTATYCLWTVGLL